MKILIVCQYFHPEPFRVTDMVIELRKAGHEVAVLTGIPNYPKGRFYPGYGLFKRRREEYLGLSISRAALVPRHRGRGLDLALNYLSFAVFGSLSAMSTRKGDFDVVLVYQLSPVTMALPGIVASRRARAPLVLYVADLWPESLSASGGISSERVVDMVGKMVERIYRSCSRILVSSAGFISSIVARGIPRSAISYVPQYPESVYQPHQPNAMDPERNEMPRGFIVAFTGNIGEAQGLETMVEAAVRLAHIDDLYWVIIGDGRASERIRTLAESRGVREKVIFLGQKPMEKIPIYLSLADVALLILRPAPLFALTLPAKIQSYLACGKPIIGCVDGDAARIIEEAGAGLTGPAGDADRLAENVLAFYGKDRKERQRYSQNALRYFEEHFEKSKVIALIENELLGVIRRCE